MTVQKETQERGWNFDHSYASLPNIFYEKTKPTPVASPQLVILNESLAATMGLYIEGLNSKIGLAEMAGNQIPTGAFPIAQAYAGHQFGHFTMLGDGRAILLGEQITPSNQRVDIQLKGSGLTPFSRRGDGRATLGPMLREYIMSEAMFALGIPTTRSLAVIHTGESVNRERHLPGAILVRVATSHIRVGTFEYAAHRGKVNEMELLANYTIQRHDMMYAKDTNPYLSLLRETIQRQAALIAKWQLVGFIHGVMNTDNMAIGGETIDYGPCAFMDTYNPATVFSSIDQHGRYAYANQPYMAAWNLSRFAETLLPLLHKDQDQAIQIATKEIDTFSIQYQAFWLSGMYAKLGISSAEEGDEALVQSLLDLMSIHRLDYTNTFRILTLEMSGKPIETLNPLLFSNEQFRAWHDKWQDRIARQPMSKEEIYRTMKHSNPAVIPRNHRIEEALSDAVRQFDYNKMHQLLEVLSNPYEYTSGQEKYATLPPEPSQDYQTFCGT